MRSVAWAAAPEDRPGVTRVSLLGQPGEVVIADHRKVEARGLGLLDIVNELVGATLLAHHGVAERGHGRSLLDGARVNNLTEESTPGIAAKTCHGAIEGMEAIGPTTIYAATMPAWSTDPTYEERPVRGRPATPHALSQRTPISAGLQPASALSPVSLAAGDRDDRVQLGKRLPGFRITWSEWKEAEPKVAGSRPQHLP